MGSWVLYKCVSKNHLIPLPDKKREEDTFVYNLMEYLNKNKLEKKLIVVLIDLANRFDYVLRGSKFYSSPLLARVTKDLNKKLKTEEDWKGLFEQFKVILIDSKKLMERVSDGFIKMADIGVVVVAECELVVSSQRYKEFFEKIEPGEHSPRWVGITKKNDWTLEARHAVARILKATWNGPDLWNTPVMEKEKLMVDEPESRVVKNEFVGDSMETVTIQLPSNTTGKKAPAPKPITKLFEYTTESMEPMSVFTRKVVLETEMKPTTINTGKTMRRLNDGQNVAPKIIKTILEYSEESLMEPLVKEECVAESVKLVEPQEVEKAVEAVSQLNTITNTVPVKDEMREAIYEQSGETVEPEERMVPTGVVKPEMIAEETMEPEMMSQNNSKRTQKRVKIEEVESDDEPVIIAVKRGRRGKKEAPAPKRIKKEK